MRISVKKEYGIYVTRIYLRGDIVYAEEHNTREEATHDAWVNALFIRDIAAATEQSVEALTNV